MNFFDTNRLHMTFTNNRIK